VTHGSQLQVAFPRAFPAYVHMGLLDAIMDNYGGRWINLYRETDHIAGPVLSWQHWAGAKEDRARVLLETTTALPQGEMFESYPYASRTRRTPVDRKADAVFSTGLRVCGHDWRLLDPVPHDPGADDGPVFQIRKHSAYHTDPNWKYAVNRVGGLHELEDYPPAFRGPDATVDAALPESASSHRLRPRPLPITAADP
jgi:hypothetical protein